MRLPDGSHRVKPRRTQFSRKQTHWLTLAPEFESVLIEFDRVGGAIGEAKRRSMIRAIVADSFR